MKGVVPIGDARRISRERNCPIVVVFAIEANRERFTVTSYGATKALCRVGGDYANQIAEAVMGTKVVAQEVEPTHLPEMPATWRSVDAAQPLDAWHEGEGSVLWWRFPIDEPPYVGSPLCDDWPGYHTHWTRIVVPALAIRQATVTS